MLRTHFDHQIENLRDDLLHLGDMVEIALSRAIKSLATRNSTTAAWIIQDDVQINYARYAVEEQAITLLATQQPVASDMRFLTAVTAIASELERIGDYASIIARRVERICARSTTPLTLSPTLYRMATLAQQMLHSSLEAFLHQDIDQAHSLKFDDDLVDEFEGRLRSELVDIARKNPQQTETVIDLLDIIHALERVADRATNIGERVIYLAGSAIEELNV